MLRIRGVVPSRIENVVMNQVTRNRCAVSFLVHCQDLPLGREVHLVQFAIEGRRTCFQLGFPEKFPYIGQKAGRYRQICIKLIIAERNVRKRTRTCRDPSEIVSYNRLPSGFRERATVYQNSARKKSALLTAARCPRLRLRPLPVPSALRFP